MKKEYFKSDLSTTLNLVKFDIFFQVKQGFYMVYAILTAIYAMILYTIPLSVRPEVTAYFILSDTSIIGLTFVGALVLLEKQQNTLQSLFVTPVKLSSYIWGKVASLTLISLLASCIIGFLPGGLIHNPVATIISVFLSAMFFTFLGLGISARVESLNQYIVGIILGGMTMSLPLVLYFIVPQLSLLFPINAAIDLMIVPPELQTAKGIIGNSAVLVCWNLLAYRYAMQQFNKHVIHK
jgi:fluoroquinolone transport system permease protein